MFFVRTRILFLILCMKLLQEIFHGRITGKEKQHQRDSVSIL